MDKRTLQCHFSFVFVLEKKVQGQRAQLAYERALKDGSVNVYRGRIFLIGQDRAGKTSLKKSLIGLPFDTDEQSTEGIQVDPSEFKVDVDQVTCKNWQTIDQNSQRLLGCAKVVARMVVERQYHEQDDDKRKEIRKIVKMLEKEDIVSRMVFERQYHEQDDDENKELRKILKMLGKEDGDKNDDDEVYDDAGDEGKDSSINQVNVSSRT